MSTRPRVAARLSAPAWLGIAAAAVIALPGCGGGARSGVSGRHLDRAGTTRVVPSPADPVRGRYGIVERTLRFRGQGSADPWDIPVTVTLVSPSHRVVRIGAFYDSPGVWKFRFSPGERGRWRWRATFDVASARSTRTGSFVTHGRPSAGFVHVSSANRYLWSTENGTPYYPLGLETCLVDDRHLGTPFAFVLDGGFRPNGGAPSTPGGPQILKGAGGREATLDSYVRTYAGAGFNLFRWSVDNCSFGLYRSISPAGNVYDARAMQLGDRLVTTLHRYGMRVYMTFFGFNPPRQTDPASMAAVLRYVKYVVDRYGAYVDFWELMNEAMAPPAWYAAVTSYLRRIDPYHHPISTSFPPANLSLFDFFSPHWYEREDELTSDRHAFDLFAHWKTTGKPVIVGEQGNSGSNWDPRSAIRMRLRIWATFFAGGALVFWNEVAFKDLRGSGAADIWLGPQERAYTRVLSQFTSGFDPLARIEVPGASPPDRVRGYELRGPRNLGLYLVAYTDHSTPTRGATVTIDSEFRGAAQWIDPATGQVLGRVGIDGGSQRLSVPAFTTDIALRAAR